MRPVRLLATVAVAVCLAACGEHAGLTVAEGIGPNPTLPEPNPTPIPTVKVADAVGWAEGQMPTPAAGLAVAPFATGLDHPRWLHVLPNGDVLVAETNAPARPEDGKGIKGWFMKQFMKKAGAGAPSANRITLLRDADGDGVAETSASSSSGPQLALRHGPGGRATSTSPTPTRWCASPTRPAHNADHGAAGARLTDLPGRRAQPPLDQEPDRQPGRHEALRHRRLQLATSARTAWTEEEGRAAIWEIDCATGAEAALRHRPAQPQRHGLGADHRHAVDGGQRARRARQRPGARLHDLACSDGGFYGWPYSYFGQNVDTRVKPPRPDLVANAIAPDYALGRPHRLARPGVRRGARLLPAAFRERRVRRPARLVEPQSAVRLQGDLRALRRRQARRPAGRRADRLPHRGRQGARPPGRRGHRRATARCWWPTTSATSSGASPRPLEASDRAPGR